MLLALSFFYELGNSPNLLFAPFQSSLNVHDKIRNNELTFYTNECCSLGVIRTHYDFTLSMLLNGIIDGKIKIEEVYLPLLFLVRHRIELAFKDNLLTLGNKLPEKKKLKIHSEHSLEKLHNILQQYIKAAIQSIPASESVFQNQTQLYNIDNQILERKMHSLDVSSRAFRFPFDKDGNQIKFSLTSRLLLDTCKLYYDTNPFLTWSVLVLAQNRYIELGDDIMNQLF